MTHSSVATGIRLTTDFGERTGKVKYFIFHHGALTSLPALIALFQPGGRSVSANYAIKDRECICTVDEDKRAKTSGSIAYDGQAVTVEVVNSTGAPNWGISDESFDTLARLIGDWSRRYGVPINNDTVLGHRELKERFGVGYATACPMVLYTRKAELLELARRYAGQSTAVPSKPTPAPAPVLSSTDVRWIQERLRVHGHNVVVDGIRGSQTISAVKAFQKKKGLTVDGIVGDAQTRPALAANPAVTGGRSVSVGSTGDLVRKVQQRLKTNYPAYARHIVVDGNFGNQTKAVVLEFQRRAKITVDGIVGEQTLKALGL